MRKTLTLLALVLLCGCMTAREAHTAEQGIKVAEKAGKYIGQTMPSQPINYSFSGNKSGPANLYPDPTLTPGDVLAADTATICQKGYSTAVRDVPISEKRQVYQEYGIKYPQPEGSYECDHFISLELGGSNDIKNLWPEPAEPKPGYHEKDLVENYLHKEVCNGHMSLQDAQNAIKTDWYKVYLSMKGLSLQTT